MIFSQLLTHYIHPLIADMPGSTAFTFVHVPELVQIADAADRTLSVPGRAIARKPLPTNHNTLHVSHFTVPICHLPNCINGKGFVRLPASADSQSILAFAI